MEMITRQTVPAWYEAAPYMGALASFTASIYFFASSAQTHWENTAKLWSGIGCLLMFCACFYCILHMTKKRPAKTLQNILRKQPHEHGFNTEHATNSFILPPGTEVLVGFSQRLMPWHVWKGEVAVKDGSTSLRRAVKAHVSHRNGTEVFTLQVGEGTYTMTPQGLPLLILSLGESTHAKEGEVVPVFSTAAAQ